jgi:5,10-methenyltetrahydromethanopterin hydrogenase
MLEGDNKYWQLNIIILVSLVIGIIILCAVFEVQKNNEIALARERELAAAEAKRNRPVKEVVISESSEHQEPNQVIEVYEPYQVVEEVPAINTDRELLADNTTDRDSDIGAKKATRVNVGDHSVVQEDEDFSSSQDAGDQSNSYNPNYSNQW